MEALIDLLSDRDPALRRVAAETLGELGDPRSAEALFKATDDEDPDTRTAAASALDRLGSVALLVRIAATWRSAVEAVGGRVRLDRADGTADRLQLTIDVPAEKQTTGDTVSTVSGALQATSADTKPGADTDGVHDQASNTGVSHEVLARKDAAVTEPPAKGHPDKSAGSIATGDDEVATTSAPAEAVDGSRASEAPHHSMPAAETHTPARKWLRRNRGGSRAHD